MKKLLVLITSSLLSINFGLSNGELEDIQYKVRPKLNEGVPAVHVEFDYKSNSRGIITLRYENSSWGDKDIFNCIHTFNVTPAPKKIMFDKDNSQIHINTNPHTSSKIQYDIVQDYDGLPMNQYRYRPMIDSSYFHLLGMRLFMIPERVFSSDNSKARVKVVYEKKDEKELFHSSFGKEQNQNIEVTKEELYASFFIGGDFRRHSFTYENDSVFFLTRGEWKTFKDADILNILKEITQSQRSFWDDPRSGDFSVCLIPTYEKWYSVGGSGFSNSFISFASNNDQVSLSHMKWLYNHEFLHKWIGRTIINENDVEEYWFSEGFTDYYAYKLSLKGNKISANDYIDFINNEVIIPHYRDTLNTTPNTELTFEKYWSSYASFQKLPYRRGLLYAFYIDNQIKKKSNYSISLDELMHDLFKLALEDKSLRFNDDLFLDELNKYLDYEEIQIDFNKYILNGELIDFKDNLPSGISIELHQNIPLLKIKDSEMTQITEKLRT